ncbi:MAG: ASKHA domain-containing protein [Oscillospiraceae bacterium]|nr:ASKHA domain-containing protein [Oscillospiraceae bacterium]
MDKLIKITEFHIKISKENVLNSMSCFPGSPVYERVSREFDRLLPAAECIFEPAAYARFENARVYCLITAGRAVSDYSKRLFDSGEALDGLIVNAIADDFVFSADGVLAERIKTECAELGKGIAKRLEASADIPPEAQKDIAEKTGAEGVSLMDGMMFEPVKTLGYILELTDDSEIFNAQHDCSKCKNRNCPRRSAPYKSEFEVVSDYAYSSEATTAGDVICIDIGTTTLAFELIRNGKAVASHSEINTQRRFGLDVLSRIEASNRGRSMELQQIIRYHLINGISKLMKEAKSEKPERVVIAANTTMVYLLMGYPCGELGVYPFNASHTETVNTVFDKVVPNSKITAETVILGGLSAFVGGDITSGMYMCDFDLSNKINLFIDLGTNGEMAIGNRDRIIVTSAAAGPAFEGGRISCGIGSVDGAVCGADIRSGMLKTINDKPSAGICGTGIIELVFELLDNHLIDETGLLIPEYFSGGYPLTEKIRFTQGDIREVQMAKSAVRAGIETLMLRYGANVGDIDTLYLAGGFGYGLKIEKACGIGLIPPELAGRVKILGNSALGGAVKYATDNSGGERIEKMKSIASEIHLGNDEKFNELYMENMNFQTIGGGL